MEEQITELIEEGKFDEAIALISQAIVSNNEDDRLYFLRGKVHWKKGMRKEAMNDYGRGIIIHGFFSHALFPVDFSTKKI